jgi:hypothetical protein
VQNVLSTGRISYHKRIDGGSGGNIQQSHLRRNQIRENWPQKEARTKIKRKGKLPYTIITKLGGNKGKLGMLEISENRWRKKVHHCQGTMRGKIAILLITVSSTDINAGVVPEHMKVR